MNNRPFDKSEISKTAKSQGRQFKTLNLNTYKDHSLGDYVETIRRNGTVDSYSTESIELEHQSPKSRYLRTSRKDFERQLSCIERRQARIRRIRQKLNSSNKIGNTFAHEKGLDSSVSDSSYHIGKTQNYPLDLGAFSRENRHDPAAKGFTENLKDHLLPRIHSRLKIKTGHNESVLTDELATIAQSSVLVKNNRIYQHKLARFYYTSYDVRRSEDVINPRTPHCNIMLLSDLKPDNVKSLDSSTTHPFLYARVIGIYHANIIYTGPGMKGYEAMRFDFLYVRWFQLDTASRPLPGWASSRLDRLSFPPLAAAGSFGFLDPSLVLRGCHIIPAFAFGNARLDGVGLSRISKDANDFKWYYANRFADRDMTMRYHWGIGIGHTYSHGKKQQDSAPASAQEPEVIPHKLPSNSSCQITTDAEQEREDEIEQHDKITADVEEEQEDEIGQCDLEEEITADAEEEQEEEVEQHDPEGEITADVEQEQEDEVEAHDSEEEEEDLDSGGEDSASGDESECQSDENDEDYLEIYETYHSD